MTRRRRKTRRLEAAYRWSNESRSVEVGRLLQRAPQFSSLTTAPAGSDHVLTEAQQKFVDDFGAEVRRGAGDDDDAS